MPKLTKKQNSKLSSRKTKKLLGGGSFFRNPFKSKKPKAEKIHTPEPQKKKNILAESPYSHLQRERPINTAEQTLRKTLSTTLKSHLNEVKQKGLSPESEANYFINLKTHLGNKFTKKHLQNVIKNLGTKLQQNPNPNPNPNPTYARLQRASAPPLISASTSTPPQLPPPRETVSKSAYVLSALIRSSSAGETGVNGQKIEVMPNGPVRKGAFRGMTNSQANKIVTINEELAKYNEQSKLSSNNAKRVKKLLENKTRNGSANINPDELNLLKKALKVIAANQQKSPANEQANLDESLYSKVIPKGQRSVPVAPALPPRLGSNTSENIRQGKSLVFNQGQQEKTEIYRRSEENNIGSNRRIRSSMELKNETRRSSYLNSYIKNLEELGNSSFINKTRNTQTENSIMEKYLFNKNPEYINEYKSLNPIQQDIIRRRFLTYSPAEISRMAKDDDLYSIFYSELINKF